jgi:hypothetical protein
MDSLIFIAHHFASVSLKAQSCFALGILATCVVLALVIEQGFHLVDNLATKSREAKLAWAEYQMRQHNGQVETLNKIEFRLDLFGYEIPTQTAEDYYCQAEGVWENTKDQLLSARAFHLMNRLAKAQPALLEAA